MDDKGLRECARQALIGHAMDMGDELDVAEIVLDETGHQLEEHELPRVLRLIDDATVIVLFGDELTTTDSVSATPGPWEIRERLTPRIDSSACELAIRSVSGLGHGIRNPADVRLIVALRNAYWAATNLDPPYDSDEKENRL